MKTIAIAIACSALLLALPAAATVSIEFQIGGIEVPAGSIGVLVADTTGDGFADPSASSGILSVGETIGDDVVVAILPASTLPAWGTNQGVAGHVVIDYAEPELANLGVAAGQPLILHIFPDRAEDDSLRPGEPHLSYRSEDLTLNSTSAFALPPDGGAYLLAALGPEHYDEDINPTPADLSALDIAELPYATGGGLDRSLSTTARHTYYFELASSGFLTLEMAAAAEVQARLLGPGGQTVASSNGGKIAFFENLPAGLYRLELFREDGGGSSLAYGLDFAGTDLRTAIADVAVGASLAKLVGNHRLNGAGGQLATLTSKKAKRVTGYATVVNRGDRPSHSFKIKAGKKNALFNVAYFDGPRNITANLVKGTHLTAPLAANGAPATIRVQFTPNKKKLVKKKGGKTKIQRKTFNAAFRADTTQGRASFDTATLRVKTR